MRICKTLFCLLFIVTIFPKTVVAMEDPDESTWGAALVNKIKKKIDPLGYATNNKAFRSYRDALSYDPSSSDPKTLNMDDTSKKVIKKIIPRMIAGLDILHAIVESRNPDNPDLDTMLKAKKNMPGFFSECDDAILLGLHNWKRNIHKKELADYDYYVPSSNDSNHKSQIITPAKSKTDLVVSAANLKKLACKSYNRWNPLELVAEGVNYLNKHYYASIDHITTVDSEQMCMGMLYFNPLNPYNKTDSDFTLNPDLDWHRLLVKKVIDREKIYLTTLSYYLIYNKQKQVMQLSRPKVETPNSTVPSSLFSQVTDSLCSGYLARAQAKKIDDTPEDPKALEEKQRKIEAQKKAAEEEAKKKLEEERLNAEKNAEEQKIKDETLRKKIEDEITQRLAAKAEKEKADIAAHAASEKKEQEENENFQKILPKPLHPPAKPTIKLGLQPQQ